MQKLYLYIKITSLHLVLS